MECRNTSYMLKRRRNFLSVFWQSLHGAFINQSKLSYFGLFRLMVIMMMMKDIASLFLFYFDIVL